MEYVYFSTNNGKLVTNWDIAKAATIVNGKEIGGNELEQVRKYAKSCKGIKKEIKNPSIKYLLAHGDKYTAIKIYYRRHPEKTLKEARDVIEEILRKMNGVDG